PGTLPAGPAPPGNGPPAPREPPRSAPGKPIGRRVALGIIGAGVVGVLAGRRIGDGINAVLAPVQRHDPTGIGSLLPSTNQWVYYTVTNGYPHKSDADYRLTVDGLVDRPETYDLASLKALPPTHLTDDFQCVTGWRVPKVGWTGVKLVDLLDRAGVQASGRAVRFGSFDGLYTESLTLDQARRPDVIVAWEMLGAPVTTEHGGPVRLYVAPMYGYKSCKWLNRIQVTDRVIPGYWETEGNYDVDAWVGRSNGRTDPPTG
ncbi:MAG: molybdopterin-dependent oxidoreductase, partial [Acidimicrobiaceae bacterium]|nr:molybdopterin-dependent oxidoreductase [Acidimicrobiaceae bacterium]